MIRPVAALGLALALAALAAPAVAKTVVILRGGERVEGDYLRHSEESLSLRVPVRRELGGGSILGSADRPIRWTDIETIDGMSIAGWLESREAPEPEEDAPAGSPFSSPRAMLDRYGAWLAAGEGFGVAFRLGALVLLVALPIALVRGAAYLLVLEHVEFFRAAGASLLALGGGAATLRIEPGWVRDWPLGAAGAAAVLAWLVLRPPVGRGIVLVLLQLAGMAGAVAAALVAVGRFA